MGNLKKGDLIIGSIDKGSDEVSFAKKPVVQPNFLVASQEAERLAKNNTNKKYMVCEVKGICSVNTTTWE